MVEIVPLVRIIYIVPSRFFAEIYLTSDPRTAK